MFQKGDRLVCISTPPLNDGCQWMTIGKQYICLGSLKYYTEVICDRGDRQFFYNERFLLAPQDSATDAGALEYEEIMSYGNTVDL